MTLMRDSAIPHPAWIEIDLCQFKKNLREIRNRIGEKRFCLCVKADAYGHGLIEIGKVAELEGIDYLAVAFLKEGIFLRQAGLVMPILVLGAFDPAQIQDFIEYNLEFTISSRMKAELVEEICTKIQKKCRVHLEVDTGLRRTGVRVETAIELIPSLFQYKYLELVGVYSHFASSYHPNNPVALEQISQFSFLQQKIGKKNLIWHLANSGGVMFYPESHFDMVRPGFVCYGYMPDGKEDKTGAIAPIFSLKARVSYFKVVKAGEGIGYNHLYTPSKQTRVVTVPLGYADGFKRDFSNKGFVLIRGKKFKIVGIVCMDQFMVDIGDNEAYVGDEVTLIGRQGADRISMEEAASVINTVPHELLCSLNGRLSRYYRVV